jgi:hypothetical protein
MSETEIKQALEVIKQAIFASPSDIESAWRAFLQLRGELVKLKLLSQVRRHEQP